MRSNQHFLPLCNLLAVGPKPSPNPIPKEHSREFCRYLRSFMASLKSRCLCRPLLSGHSRAGPPLHPGHQLWPRAPSRGGRPAVPTRHRPTSNGHTSDRPNGAARSGVQSSACAFLPRSVQRAAMLKAMFVGRCLGVGLLTLVSSTRLLCTVGSVRVFVDPLEMAKRKWPNEVCDRI